MWRRDDDSASLHAPPPPPPPSPPAHPPPPPPPSSSPRSAAPVYATEGAPSRTFFATFSKFGHGAGYCWKQLYSVIQPINTTGTDSYTCSGMSAAYLYEQYRCVARIVVGVGGKCRLSTWVGGGGGGLAVAASPPPPPPPPQATLLYTSRQYLYLGNIIYCDCMKITFYIMIGCNRKWANGQNIIAIA